ncbi:MAG: GNAT family N-acetyltransferase [Telluria sp.]
MTTATYCLFLACLAPIICTGGAKMIGSLKGPSGPLDNRNPRQWLAQQTGVGSVGPFFRNESTVMEMGWNTYRAFWGKGIANEAAAAVLNYVFEVRREPKVRALIASGNESSRRVAERLGMTYQMKTELNGKEIDSYMRERA